MKCRWRQNTTINITIDTSERSDTQTLTINVNIVINNSACLLKTHVICLSSILQMKYIAMPNKLYSTPIGKRVISTNLWKGKNQIMAKTTL